MRIYEVAKELGKTNKEIMEFLKDKEVDVKSHMSNLDDTQESMVRNAFQQKSAAPEKTAAKNEESKKPERPKKKNIIQVFRPQNATSQQAKNFRGNRPSRPGARPEGGKAQGASRPLNGSRQAEGAKQEPVKTEAVKSQVQPKPQEPVKPQVQPRPQEPVKPQGQAKQHEMSKPQVQPKAQDTAKPQGQARTEGTNRPGQNTATGGANRQNGNAGNRQNGNTGYRQSGQNRDDRPRFNNNGENRRGGGRDDRPRFNNNGENRRNDDRARFNNGENRRSGDDRRRPDDGRRSGDFRKSDGDFRKSDDFRKDGNANNRRPGDNHRSDVKKQSSDTVDVGLKKPSRDINRKEKDKNKVTLREEKFNSDRRAAHGGNRPNQGKRQMNNVPKALQKTVHQKPEEKKEVVKEILLPEKMTIRELAEKMKMQPSVIVKKLFMEGILVTVNHEIDFEKAQEIALEYDIIAEPEPKVDVIEELLREDAEDEADMVTRPPVVCVMGHVDHGKTSLLDAIRNTQVTAREAGGITQHIGAYTVSINGQKITFLDTPGHEAFTAMRMRGANATDVAILVVAADDGVMPQTVEAINHAKAAGVEIIVAINKIDKPSANVERVKQELAEYQLIPEDWGGSTIFVPVSARTQEGIENLLEMILLTAEVMELKANPKRRARGLVIEAQLDKGKGPVATILIQKGTLHVGDFIAAGACSGKVRAMMDDKGRRVKEAGPSTPVEILGLGDVPNAGEVLVATENDKEAKNFAATFISENKNRLLEETKAKMSLDDLFNQIQEGNLKELNIVVKADVQGSVEAVKQSLTKLSNEEVVVKVIHGGVGAINESDVSLASASNAIIIGFNVRPDATAKAIAEQEGVDLRLYRVIYQAIEDVEAAMKGMLDPIFEEKVIGHAEVRQLFKASGVGTIAGSYVMDGIFQRNCKVRITREGEQIFEGALASLKRFKDDVKEVKTGYECGLVFEGFNDVKEEDRVEAYIMVEVPR